MSGTVTLAPRIAVKASAEAALFLIARAGAERRIVAVRRESGVRFPYRFELSAADAMTEGTSFAGPLEITARFSKTGDAMPTPGDIEGVVKNVAPGSGDVRLTLETVRR